VALDERAVLAARTISAATRRYLWVRLLVSALWVLAGLAAAGGSFATFVGARALAGSHAVFAAAVAAVFAGAAAASPFLVAIAILYLLMVIADGSSTEEREGLSPGP
jgi:hypothetical protein